MVELMSSPSDPALSSKSVKTEVVSLTKSFSCCSLSLENELNLAEVFMLHSDYSQQEEILSISTKPSPSSEVISFD